MRPKKKGTQPCIRPQLKLDFFSTSSRSKNNQIFSPDDFSSLLLAAYGLSRAPDKISWQAPGLVFTTDYEPSVLVLFVEETLMLCRKATGFLMKVIFVSSMDVRRNARFNELLFVTM